MMPLNEMIDSIISVYKNILIEIHRSLLIGKKMGKQAKVNWVSFDFCWKNVFNLFSMSIFLPYYGILQIFFELFLFSVFDTQNNKWKYQWPLFCVIKHLFRALSCICCLLCFVLFCFVICFVYFNVNDKSENIFSF